MTPAEPSHPIREWPLGTYESFTAQDTIGLDTAGPTTTHTISPSPNAAGWNNSDVAVTLDATDPGGLGVREIAYSINGGPNQIYNSPEIPVRSEGVNTVSYFATDKAGNRESPAKTLTVKIDKTRPASNVTINGGEAYTNNTTVNLTLSTTHPSSGSGVNEMRFSEDGTTWSEWEPLATRKEWVVSDGDGEKRVYVQFKDAAGNESGIAHDTIILDKTAPTVSSTSPSNYATGVDATANISATFLEEGSGMDPDTLDESTFKVVWVKPTGNEQVEGDVGYHEDGDSQTATFDPTDSLAKGFYRATLTSDVADKAGNALADEYTWTFATAGPPKG